MKRILLKKWGLPLALLAMTMLLLSGCQSVAGLDINKALVQSMTQVSGESKQTLSIELVPAEGVVHPEAQQIIEQLNSLSLTIDSAKVQDQGNMSVKGAVQYKEEQYPFHLSLDEQGMAIQLEGAKQPIYISTESGALSGMYAGEAAKYEDQILGFTKQAGEFFFKHLSNPKTLSVKQTQSEVFGESLSLTQLHTEIRGDELLAMVKPFLTSVAKDEQGIKDLIGAFYDVYYPIMQEAYSYYDDYYYEDYYEDEYYDDYYYEDYDYEDYDYEYDDSDYSDVTADRGFGLDLFSISQSKPVVVATMTATIQEVINTLLTDYDANMKSLLEETPELNVVLGKDTVLDLDLYFDSKLQIRKQAMELTIALPASEDLPLQSVKLKADTEQRNLGGTVEIDAVDVTSGVIDYFGKPMTPGEMLRNFESDSAIYKLLKDDFQFTYKSVYLDPHNSYYGVVVNNNTTFVPLRYLSEELDAGVKWDAYSKNIVITDDITGQEIRVTPDSKHASIGGKAVVLEQPVFVNEDGVTYVPLRFMSEALGAKVTVEEDGWIFIERP
ncbi:copper amine oxidase N-terminal domain-containing protein [Paenibacillus antibioticophila]|uniref:copper amine oxidase N-terminal domain-containing protein n=1 Tax=Paenibacillus antibioticophila TaxID=1274374 RepID=UPI0005C94EFB|nr:copper amine oxidase N-terminal domain-containing protein [Paenibacillus antibioticophila]